MTTRKRNRDVKYMQYHKCMQTFVTFLERVTGDEKNGTYIAECHHAYHVCVIHRPEYVYINMRPWLSLFLILYKHRY